MGCGSQMKGVCQPLLSLRDVLLACLRFTTSLVVTLNFSATSPLGKGGTSSPAVWEGAFWMVNCCRVGATPVPAFAHVRLHRGSQRVQQPSVPAGWLPASVCKGGGQHKAAYSDPARFRNFPMAPEYPRSSVQVLNEGLNWPVRLKVTGSFTGFTFSPLIIFHW